MDTNFNSHGVNTLYLENVENYVVINEEMYKSIVSSIECNYLLILFTMTCFVGILCSIKKPKNDYVLVQDANPVKGEIIEKV
tara:strand:- start:185 stop:430 length:246 start_codon:yes stop_codon:yes gene_type:complete